MIHKNWQELIKPKKVEFKSAGTNKVSLVAEPLERGFGLTLGNALRRVLMSSLRGAAVTAVQIDGVLHEFSSIAGVRTHRFMHAYCVSKAGVDMLVRTCADELGSAGVRVNSVCPGLVDTEIAQGLFGSEEVLADYLDCMPLQRTGVVEDIANAVRFLCGPESSWITGVSLSVDGGHHLRRGPNYDSFSRAMFGDDLTEGKF